MKSTAQECLPGYKTKHNGFTKWDAVDNTITHGPNRTPNCHNPAS